MKIKKLIPIFLTVIGSFMVIQNSQGQNAVSPAVESPSGFFGFQPGTDRELFNYEKLIDYLKVLDSGSDRLKLVEIGQSPMGRQMYIAFLSSAENIRDLERLREINRRLALDPDIPADELESMIRNGKVFVLATLSMHSNEVAPSQAAPLIAWDLVTTNDPRKLEWLGRVVWMMVPTHNPDGMDMMVEHYLKYSGTIHEGSTMPGVYHKYVGHDNNRDYITLSQNDTRAVSSIYSHDWFPQIMVDKHQMGPTGVRYFVPPPHDPIAENIDAGIWNWVGVFGSHMITDMTSDGLKGIAQRFLFDDYWPGSAETCKWKNVISFLTEGAGVQIASPIYIEPGELRVHGKGLSEYKKSINMPELWPGGWWRLSDLVSYEISSSYSILKTASNYDKSILKFRNELCQSEVKRGKTQAPYFYIIPLQQHDQGELVRLVNLLREHNISLYQLASDQEVQNSLYRKGDVVIPLSQAFRPFIKEVMERQYFPVRHYTPDGEIIRPYDITSWSLPLHRGIHAVEVNFPQQGLYEALEPISADFDLKGPSLVSYDKIILPVEHNESYALAFLANSLGLKTDRLTESVVVNETTCSPGGFVITKGTKMEQVLKEITTQPVYLTDSVKLPVKSFQIPRIALVESWFHDMDAGWTRFIFDQSHIPYQVIRPGDFEKTDLAKEYDVIVFPGEDKSILMTGKYKSGDEYIPTNYPPEFTKGMGDKGMEKLMTFLDNGGIIVSWGESTELFSGPLTIKRNETEKEDFKLPFRDISATLKEQKVFCPGSLLKVDLVRDHPLTAGVPSQIGVFSRGTPVFATQVPIFDMDRRVIASYAEKDILMSGYCENEEKLANQAVLIWLKKGKGQLVLFGFNPQFRASTQATYKLLFNALLLDSLDD
ncbi:MAG TPA: M14 family metallopeptidase [Bacteroidales bacterium]|nr:M14 family metallopeptidase [Bacteroidales bacterium]